MAQPVFNLQNIYKTRPGSENYRLEIRQFRVFRGETIALIGPSGCGKSTALESPFLRSQAQHSQGQKPAALHLPARSGRYARCLKLLAQRRPERPRRSTDALSRLRSARTGGLLPFLNAVDNIMLASKVLNVVHERAKAIASICSRLGITPLLHKFPAALSVGERQRVAIARALAHKPTVILADEPTAALDPTHASLVMKLFLEIARDEGSTFIVVSHDQRLVSELGFSARARYRSVRSEQRHGLNQLRRRVMLIRECFQMFCLATADYRRERLLSLCSILGLAAVLAPLLVLYGVKFGVVTTMVSRMRSDPLTLELSPVSSGHFTQDFFTSLRQEPGVAFVLPRTRSIAATMQLSNTDGNGTRRTVVCSMEPTAAGDPLLARYGCEAPAIALQEGKQTSPGQRNKTRPGWRNQEHSHGKARGRSPSGSPCSAGGRGAENPGGAEEA